MRWAGLGFLAAVAALAFAPDAGAVITPYPIQNINGPLALAEAMTRGEAGNTLVVDAYWLDYPPAVAAAGTADEGIGPLFGIPDGLQYTILTTGNVLLVDNPQFVFASTAAGGVGRGTTTDASTLSVVVEVPSPDNCISFRFQFLSEEYPTWVNTIYNDAFVAELDATSWLSIAGNNLMPGNFAMTPGGGPVTVSTVPFAYNKGAATTSAPSVYDGGSDVYQTQTPVTPGMHVVHFSIFDAVDAAYDSAVFIDDLYTYYVPNPDQDCQPGLTEVPPPQEPYVPPPDPCSTVMSHATDGEMVPAFGGKSLSPRWYRAEYVNGAMRRHLPQTGWDVQHAAGNAGGHGIFVVDAGGGRHNLLPGTPTNSLTQAQAEGANMGAFNKFWWPGGPMAVQHFDHFDDNLGGLPAPTWKICPSFAPPPSPPPPPPAPPASPICAPASQTVAPGVMAALSASGGNGAYDWSATHGTPSKASGPTYNPSFGNPGTYEVTLRSGPLSTQCIVVVPPYPPPAASFAATFAVPYSCGPRMLVFQDSSTSPNGDVVSWHWEFGDGATATDRNPGHTYGESGTYRVVLTVTDEVGASQTRTRDIAVAIDECTDGAQAPHEAPGPPRAARDGLDEDVAGEDSDEDGTADRTDNCPLLWNDDQADLDLDGAGDLCDLDDDGDGVADGVDNCPADPNQDQEDRDTNGIGDACDELLDGPAPDEQAPVERWTPAPGASRDVAGIAVQDAPGSVLDARAGLAGAALLLAAAAAVAVVALRRRP